MGVYEIGECSSFLTERERALAAIQPEIPPRAADLLLETGAVVAVPLLFALMANFWLAEPGPSEGPAHVQTVSVVSRL
jgi:hypothetical protein